MPFGNRPLGDIAEADLQGLIQRGVVEGKTLDYKRDRVGNADSDRREFLYDVSSFANAAGGFLILGIDEAGGQPTAVPGIAGLDADQEILRLEQLARDGIRPVIVGLQSRAVPLANGNVVILIRIPKSWNPPHQVVFQRAFRFYGRGSNGKYLLDVDELRSVFTMSQTAAERIRQARVECVAKVVAGETRVPLRENARVILQALPLSAFAAGVLADITAIDRDHRIIYGIANGAGSVRHNVDGLLLTDDPNGPANYYAQVFRNGSIETVTAWPEWEDRGLIYLASSDFETEVVRQVAGIKRALIAMGVEPPLVLLLSIVGMRGWRMGTRDRRMLLRNPAGFDRDPLLIPETVLNGFEAEAPTDAKPLIDCTWNASGWAGSPNYDGEGNYQLPWGQ